MKKLRKPVFVVAGYNTISLGSGRKEFHPKKPRPGIEHYIQEAGRGAIEDIGGDASLIDEGIISNFMAARFNKQGHLASLIPTIDPALKYKPCTRVEGACGSGGLGLYTAMKTILSDLADVVLVIGVEVQNTVKAVYGADILAGAGHYEGERKAGHAYFFPSKFSERAGAYSEKFGKERTREAMAHWYVNAIENARHEPKAQEYHNRIEDLFATGMTPPNPKAFLEHLNVFDCSKVSDGASAVIFASEEGLKRLGKSPQDAVMVAGFGQCEANLTETPEDPTKLTTTAKAGEVAYERSGLGPENIGLLEVHDCFTISGLLSTEALGFADYGEGPDFVRSGHIKRDARVPTNVTGGLIGFGHYTGGTGVRQAADIQRQLIGTAGDSQIQIDPERPYGMMVSMGGNDKTVSCVIFKKAA